MTKILVIVLITVLLVMWLKRMGSKRDGAGRPPQAKAPEDMVRCKVCSVNLPRSEAILSQGQFYCCEAHRQHG